MFWVKYRHVIYVVVEVVGVVVVVVVDAGVVVLDTGVVVTGGWGGQPAQSVNVSTQINKLKKTTLIVI
jgi:hypothetical protein